MAFSSRLNSAWLCAEAFSAKPRMSASATANRVASERYMRVLPWNRRVAYRTRLLWVNRAVAGELRPGAPDGGRTGSVLHVFDQPGNLLLPRPAPSLEQLRSRTGAALDHAHQRLQVERLVPALLVARAEPLEPA